MVAKGEATTMETAEISRGIIQGQLDPQLYFTHLTELEQKLLLGGSVSREDVEGNLMSNEEIFQSDETSRIHPADDLSVEQITRERRHKFIEGYFPIFHSLKMLEKGYKHRVYLPTVRDGRIEPRFVIHLLTAAGELVQDQELIDEVMRNFPQDYQKYFTLSPGRKAGELTLVKSVRVASSPVAV